MQENLTFEQQEKNYQPRVLETEVKNLIAYFEVPPAPEWLEALQAKYPEVQISVEQHQEVDWLEKWKQQWKPFELIPEFWIVPDWHRGTFKPEVGRCLYIEPGMAFGTGTHATTQLAAQLIQKVVTENTIHSLLDVGTGSGILALLAHLFDVNRISAYDNDPESKRVLFENLEKNQQPAVDWVENWSVSLAGQTDLTVANIIDGVLLDLKDQFKKVESPFYIFTGILAERDSDFVKEMTDDWELEILDRRTQDEWVGYLMKASQ